MAIVKGFGENAREIGLVEEKYLEHCGDESSRNNLKIRVLDSGQ